MFKPPPLPITLSPLRAVTLIAVVAVLTALALPGYNEYTMRGHRAHARATLLEAAQWMERTATARGRYPAAAAIPAGVLAVEGGRYKVVARSQNGLDYTLTATPAAEQTSDRCGVFQINQAGTRRQVATIEVPDPLGPLECWNR
ncbi:MAG: prepilin-type cleavage/methylation domain-containing protein [Burkholderiales bacterium]|nr:MAG: prepilin-type cleavage/methylation domain-containing protein [Burkholderiales bacterium]